MPGHCWGTPDQIEFLTGRLPDFQEAQRNKTTAAFWIDINQEFFKRWPGPEAEVFTITALKKSRLKKGKQPARKDYSGNSLSDWTDDRKNVSQLLH
jgi:hypothetical protein